LCSSISRPPPPPALLPYTTLFRSAVVACGLHEDQAVAPLPLPARLELPGARVEKLPLDPALLVRFAHNDVSSMVSMTRSSTLRRSEEHTSELQSRENLVCRLLLEK